MWAEGMSTSQQEAILHIVRIISARTHVHTMRPIPIPALFLSLSPSLPLSFPLGPEEADKEGGVWS